jgi:hypothetical protein
MLFGTLRQLAASSDKAVPAEATTAAEVGNYTSESNNSIDALSGAHKLTDMKVKLGRRGHHYLPLGGGRGGRRLPKSDRAADVPASTSAMPSTPLDANISTTKTGSQLDFHLRGSANAVSEAFALVENFIQAMSNSTSEDDDSTGFPSEVLDLWDVEVKASRRYFPLGGGGFR